jgi:hypothetical protein
MPRRAVDLLQLMDGSRLILMVEAWEMQVLPGADGLRQNSTGFLFSGFAAMLGINLLMNLNGEH